MSPYEHIHHSSSKQLARKLEEIAMKLEGEVREVLLTAAKRLRVKVLPSNWKEDETNKS